MYRVGDPHHVKADSDIYFPCNAYRIRLFTMMRLQILLLIKVMRICDHWYTDPPGLHFEPQRL